MGLQYPIYLEESTVYGCKNCRTHLAVPAAILSHQFQGLSGQAYLLQYVVNVIEGEEEHRAMTTGLHTVRNISCVKCKTVVGWTYVQAYGDRNKFKEGKSVLEKDCLMDVD